MYAESSRAGRGENDKTRRWLPALLESGFADGREVTVRVRRSEALLGSRAHRHAAGVRYYRHGGILPYALRQLLGRKRGPRRRGRAGKRHFSDDGPTPAPLGACVPGRACGAGGAAVK
jgi:hypothetical protein